MAVTRPATPVLDGTVLRPPAAEHDFRTSRLREDARTTAAFIGIVTLGYMGFAVSDVGFAESPRFLTIAIGARISYGLIGLAAMFSILRAHRPAVLDRWVVAWTLAYALRGVAVQSIRPADHFLPLMGEVAVTVCLWSMLALPFRVQTVAAAIVTTGAAFWTVAFRIRPPYDGGMMIISTWVLANGIGAYVSWRSNRQRRAIYLDTLRLAAAEEEARASESLLRTITDSSPDSIFAKDREGRWTFANAAALRVAGKPREAVLGRTDEEIMGDRALALPLVEHDRWVLESGASLSVEEVVPDPAGPRRFLSTKSPMRDASGQIVGIAGVAKDITELRNMEERLLVASRLAAMGTLVAGVAHEVNNPLTGMTAGAGTVLEDVRTLKAAYRSGSPPGADVVLQILDEAEDSLVDAGVGAARIAQIVKDLTVFGSPNAPKRRVPIIEVVQGAMRWISSATRHLADIRIEDLGAPDVLASPGQLEQVVVNLVTNAARSTPSGGHGEVILRIGPGSSGTAWIDVEDRGVGIPVENLQRIFDPFFTTRRTGEGMGLGLAISHAIVVGQGGSLTVTSEVGRGSTFRIELPAAPGDS